MQKVGIALIGPSGTGKTTIGKILAEKLHMHFHDMDDEGLEGAWGIGGVARVLAEKGDEGFLEAEERFILDTYGRRDEEKQYTLDTMILATSGSVVLEEKAIEYIRERMITLYLDLDDTEIALRAHARGVSRIVGMNGDNPGFESIEAVLTYRRGFYEQYADITCPIAPGNTPEEDADIVMQFIERYVFPTFPSLLQDSRSREQVSLSRAIITSQPLSGGLWCPVDFPQISLEQIYSFQGIRYQDIAKVILGSWSFGLTLTSLMDIIEQAYGSQWHDSDITPVKHITRNLYSLHLGYGPTFAFKNVALEFLPRLLSTLSKGKIVNVLGASSGDTINAAHSGVKGTNIRSIFMLPSTGPSVVQRLQAVHGIANNPNAFTLLAKIPFDPLQDIVKKINSPEFRAFKEKHNITSFNSINIARILAQTVYYFRAYAKLLELGAMQNGDKVIFSVPSGNFGDALAGYYAKKMGLPIKKIVIATNENDMLHRFFQTGRYEPPKRDGKDYVEVTNAPSMDIAKSSNFERMLFDMVDGDADRVRGWYDDLSKNGYFQVDGETLRRIQEVFISTTSTNDQREMAIRNFGRDYSHGIDPHTASSVVEWGNQSYSVIPDLLNDKDVPVIFLETSHVAQFSAELETKGIIVPGMHEFDEVLDKMRNTKPVEGKHYINTGSSFDDIMPDIKRALEEILPSRFQ